MNLAQAPRSQPVAGRQTNKARNSCMKIFLAVVVIVAFIAAAVLARLSTGDRTGKYRRRELMTDNELEFFTRLVKALPDHYIFPQVSMSALLEASTSDKKRAHSDRLRIAQQRADYVVCDARCEIVVVVELDDRTHSRAKDQIRDTRLEQAGIRTVRFQSRNKPTAEAIRASVFSDTTAPVVTAARPITTDIAATTE